LFAETVPPGVAVVDASGVVVWGTCVGTDGACLVGGRVEVTKRIGTGVAVADSVEILTHEVNAKTSRMKIQIFFI
jgi:hypothetical protein